MPYRLLLPLLAVAALSASTIPTTWTGASGGSWTTAGNWSNGVPQNSPGNNYDAIFPDLTSTATRLLTIDATISGLSLGAHNTVSISFGKTLTLDSGTFTSTGSIQGNVAISGAGNATFTSGGGILGKLTNSSTGQVTFNTTQTGDMVNPAGGIINLNGSLSMSGTSISNDGTVNLAGNFGRFGNLAVSGSGTLSLAGGTISGSSGGLTNSSTIDGYGALSMNTTSSGTISSSGSGQTLTLSGGLTNSGTVEAKNGTILNVQTFTTNSGTMIADAGGTLNLQGGADSGIPATPGSIIADGGTITLGSLHTFDSYTSGVIAQNSGKIVADTRLFGQTIVHSTGSLDESGLVSDVTVDAGGTLNVRGGNITKLSNSGSVTTAVNFTTGTLTNNAGGIITLTAGGSLTPQGTTTNNGLIQITGGGYQNQTSAISGSGTLTLNASSLYGNSLINGSGHTIQGSGDISLFITNNGNLIASGGNLDLKTDANVFTNNGLVKAATGSVFIEPAGSSRFTNFDSGVLTGGTFEADGANNIEFVGADITTNNSNIILVNGGHILDYSAPSKDGLRNFKTNDGTFDLENTTFNAQTDDFFNNGHVIVGGGSQFNTDKGAKLVNQAGGVVSGTGVINGDVDNDKGTFAPGDDPGTLNINGGYYQGLTGELDLEFATDTSWSELLVSGASQINGELRLVIDSGFDAAIGTTFQLFRSGTMTGSFANFDSEIFNGKEFQLVRLANGYDVEVVDTNPAVNSTPEPATFGMALLALAGCIVGSRRGFLRLLK